MGLRELPYAKLEPLIHDCLCHEESEETAALIKRLRPARRRGYLTPEELQEICQWKSPRVIHCIEENTAKQIRAATSAGGAHYSSRSFDSDGFGSPYAA